jgi:hypothetical protein
MRLLSLQSRSRLRELTDAGPPFGGPAPSQTSRFAGLAVGATALGLMAVGAISIGALSIGAIRIGRTRIRKLRIDELEVGRLSVTGEGVE